MRYKSQKNYAINPKIGHNDLHNLLTISNLVAVICRSYAVIITDYLPIQNLLKIFSSRSSVVTFPVISPR
jgi:hypothetical protein